MRAAIGLVAFVGLSCVAHSQLFVQRVQALLTPDAAYCLLEPNIAIGQEVKSFTMSRTGRFVLAVVEEKNFKNLQTGWRREPSKYSLVLWDAEDDEATRLALPKYFDANDSSVTWLAQSNYAIIFANWLEEDDDAPLPEGATAPALRDVRKYFLLNGEDGSMPELPYSASWGETVAEFFPSPTTSFTLAVTGDYEKPGSGPARPLLAVLDSHGSIVRRIAMPEGVRGVSDFTWTNDGETCFAQGSMIGSDKKRYRRTVSIDPRKGTSRFFDGDIPERDPASPELLIQPRVLRGQTAAGSANSWWLVSGNHGQSSESLLVEHAESATLTPDFGHALYVFKGALFSRKIVKLTLDEYKEQVVKPMSMQQAKLCVLALLMYSADNDDTIKPKLDFVTELGPYAKDEDLLIDFVYSFPGGRFQDLEDPAHTEIGYIATLSGRAVAYADGHVEWKDN